jgi:hypothetical protein
MGNSKERRVGPDARTHMTAAADMEKTSVRDQRVIIDEVEQGPGAYDERTTERS